MELNLEPLHFFRAFVDLHKVSSKGTLTKHNILPYFFDTPAFAEVSVGWNEEGLACDVLVKKGEMRTFFPNFEQGDAIELFIDTRDMKNVHHPTRYCHHFFFLADGTRCGELTRFRGEDGHPHADPSFFRVASVGGRRGYELKIFIQKEALFGYDPQNIDRLGFTYRIHRYLGEPQFFSASADEFAIEQEPSLWATLKLMDV